MIHKMQDVVDALKATPYESFLLRFMKKAPSSFGFVPLTFHARPAVNNPDPQFSQTLPEWVEESREALVVAAERRFFREYPKSTLADVHKLIDADIDSTVFVSPAFLNWPSIKSKLQGLGRGNTGPFYEGCIGKVKFYSDLSRGPEHKVFDYEDIFTVEEQKKQYVYFDEPELMVGEDSEKYIKQVTWVSTYYGR